MDKEGPKMSQPCFQMELLNNVFQSMFQGCYKGFYQIFCFPKDSILKHVGETQILTNLNVFLSGSLRTYI